MPMPRDLRPSRRGGGAPRHELSNAYGWGLHRRDDCVRWGNNLRWPAVFWGANTITLNIMALAGDPLQPPLISRLSPRGLYPGLGMKRRVSLGTMSVLTEWRRNIRICLGARWGA